MKQVISIGKQDFASLRDENYLRVYLSGKKKNIKEFKDAFQ